MSTTFQSAIKDLFIDPISQERLRDPVVNSPCGHTYERSQINGWITRCLSEIRTTDCPTCRQPINGLIPNTIVRQALDVLDLPDNSLLNRIEDFTPEERRKLKRAITRIIERRAVDRQRGIPDRLPQRETFAQVATDAVVAYYQCYYTEA